MVSTLMTVSEVQEAVESDLPNSVLQLYIDEADEKIIDTIGQHALTGRTVARTIKYGDRAFDVLLPTRATQVTGVTIDGQPLSSGDWELRHNGTSLRLWFLDPFVYTTDEFTRYSWEVEVTYDAVDDTNRRKIAMIKLVKHAMLDDGISSETVGSYSKTKENLGREEQRILNNLRRPTSRFA